MNSFIEKIKLLFADSILRKRILFVFGILVVFRILAAIPIPGVNVLALEQFFSNNQFFGLMNIFSGGGLSGLSIIMLGVGPYITASIIMQLLTMMSDKLKAMYHEEGDMGKQKFMQYARLLTVPLAIVQALGFMVLLERQGIVSSLSAFDSAVNIIVITAGSLLLMWLGELISEYGIGNGVSLLIFAGIVSRIPVVLSQMIFTFDVSQIPLYIGFVFVGVLIVWGVVVITEAERPIPVTYAKRVRGQRVYGGMSTYLPLRLNQAGVIPIIFALSILLLPQMVFNFLGSFVGGDFVNIVNSILSVLNNPIFHGAFYFILVVAFTYFYTAVTFDPNAISDNLQKSGAFIPGVRPGRSTSDHLSRIITRITLVGALFLGFIAVLPVIMQNVTGISALSIGGTALLIVVSVVIDIVKRIEAQITMREY